MDVQVKQLKVSDTDIMSSLLDVFGHSFNDSESYSQNRPSRPYTEFFLSNQDSIVLAALIDEQIVGGLVAYELIKFEQERSEIYIYDLAVSEEFRRQGVATQLINELKTIAKQRNAWVIYVQADVDDEAAIQLYSKIGKPESVLHFDIKV